MSQELFRIHKGLQIDDTSQVLTGSILPGTGDSALAPKGSIYINTIDGTLHVKTVDGVGEDKWLKTSVHSPKSIYVCSEPGAGEFTSVKEAIDSVCMDASESNRYIVRVGPGIYIEDQFSLCPYVTLIGAGPHTTIIKPNNPNQNLILGNHNSAIHDLTIDGVIGATAVYLKTNTYDISKQFVLCNVIFAENQIHLRVESTAGNSAWAVLNFCFFGGNSSFDKGIVCYANGGIAKVTMRNSALVPRNSAPYPSKFLEIHGTGSYVDFLACRLPVSDIQQPGTIGVHIYDGGDLFCTASTLCRWDTGIFVENVGAAPNVVCSNMGCDTSIRDISIEHPGTTGSFTGLSNVNDTYIHPNSTFSVNYVDNQNNLTVLTGDLYLGDDHASLTNATRLILDGSTMGLYNGGVISDGGGLNVNIAGGWGYTQTGDDMNALLIAWNNDTLELPANSTSYVYFDNSGNKQYATSLPDVIKNIILGRVTTDATSIIFIDRTPYLAHHASNYLNRFNREALGPVYVTGSLVQENGVRGLNISAGEYYVSQNRKLPLGGTGISFESFYHSSGTWTHTLVSTVSNTQYDNGTNLTNLTAGYYTRHGLYVVGDGTLEKYLLVYGNQQYATLVDVEGVGSPNPPPSFIQGVVHIADIIVQEGTANIVSIYDTRPIIGFKASGVSATATHGNLFGLADDDHLQYLRVDGTRSMSGDLNMGTNDITNVGNVDGVDVSTHASRHLPNGLDPLTTAAPTGTLTTASTNTEGNANSLSRSNHTHAIAVALDDLSDVTSVGAVSGQELYFNGTVWVPRNVKVLNTWVGAIPAQSGTTTITLNGTVPAITDGTQLFSQVITPHSVNSKFLFQTTVTGDVSNNNRYIELMLFRNTTCIYTTYVNFGNLKTRNITVNFVDSPNTVAATTYSLRVGVDANTWYINRGVTVTEGGTMAGTYNILELN